MTRLKTTKLSLTGAASLLALSLAAGNAYAEQQQFDIEAQSLAKALLEFNEQSGLTVAAPRELVADKQAPTVRGVMEPEEALEKILSGSGLKSNELSTGAYTITLASAEVTEPAPQPFRVAQLDQEEDVRGVESNDDDFESEKREDVIVVTGTSIRGVTPDSAPLETFTAEDIALTGATTLERFFETVPQNLNSISPLASRLGPGRGNSNETGIDLRGLGVGTTLILLNGRRLTAPDGGSPDISLIPLGAIERVELLTDGASAVYGADAIGGVVNIILKRELDGAETALSYGSVTEGSQRQFQASQSMGTSWESGNALISYGYRDLNSLTAGDRDFVNLPDETTLSPEEEKHTFFGTVNQNITDRWSIFADLLYSSRDSSTRLDSISSRGTLSSTTQEVEQEQIFLSGGFNYQLSDSFTLEVHGSYLDADSSFEAITPTRSVGQERSSEVIDFTTKLDGKLLDLPGGEARFAVGGGFFDQEFNAPSIFLGQSDEVVKLTRESKFVFGEVFLPLISEDQNIPGVRRLEVNAAARYTDYSDFGSNTAPRVGVLWSPVDGLNLRGTYAEGFRAPTLASLNPLSDLVGVLNPSAIGLPDPFSTSGPSIALFATGVGGAELTPEFSESFTVGFDYTPEFIDGLDVSLTYFNIDYTDRLATPDPAGGITPFFNPIDFADIINTSPTRADIESIIAGYSEVVDNFGALTGDPNDLDVLANAVTVIIDNRLDNLSVSKTDGFDISIGYSHDTSLGVFSYGGRATYTIDSIQRITDTSPDITLIDTVGNPTALKFSARAGFSRGGFSGQANVNYVDDYTNVFVIPEEAVDSWTTVDLNLRYDFQKTDSILQNAALSLNINNLLDEDPPFVGERDAVNAAGSGLGFPAGYDPVNANPTGRFVTIGLTKRF